MCNLWHCGPERESSDQQAWYMSSDANLKSSTHVNHGGKVATVKPLRTLEHYHCSQDKDNDVWIQDNIKTQSGELVAQIEASV